MDCDLKPAPTHAYVCLLDSVAVVRSGMRTYYLWFISHSEVYFGNLLLEGFVLVPCVSRGLTLNTMRVLVLGMTAKAGCISLVCAAATS